MDRELLENIQHYLNGYCSLQDLEAWVLSNLQIILDSSDTKAIEVANEIDADLVQLSEGLIDELTLREHLHYFITDRDTISVPFPSLDLQAVSIATTSVETIRSQVEVPVPGVVNVRLRLEFA